MQLDHAITQFESAVATQMRIASPEMEAMAEQLVAALEPALRKTLLDVAEAAAAEISAQLVGQRVEIQLVGGDPEMTVRSETSHPTPSLVEDDEARITLRLPGYLKDLIAQAAEESGDSVNSFVVDALRGRTHSRSTKRVKRTIEL